MIKGGCLCGKVRYEYDGDIQEVVMCHCSQCRKAQGAAFAINSPVESSRLTIHGQEHLKEYFSSEDKIRAFCSHCGSPLYSAFKRFPKLKRLRLGTVDTEFTCDNRYHIFTDSVASWGSINDDYPQYDTFKR